MSLFQKIIAVLFPSPTPEVIWVYVQCGKCGEKLKIRINALNDLSVDYGEGEKSTEGYLLHKEALGNKCSNLMHLNLRFDRNRKIIRKEMTGGKFITPEEFGL